MILNYLSLSMENYHSIYLKGQEKILMVDYGLTKI